MKLGKHILKRILAGSVLENWNNEQTLLQTGLLVKPGDVLFSVNGRSDPTQVIRALTKLSDVTLRWHRFGPEPETFDKDSKESSPAPTPRLAVSPREELESLQFGDHASSTPEQILEFTVAHEGNFGLRLSLVEAPPVILAIDEGSLAATAGAQVGDRLFALNGVSVLSMAEDDLIAKVKGTRPLKVRILSSGPGGVFGPDG
jgi:hypothetical protein